jgi:AcrR family transcriptional regulator
MPPTRRAREQSALRREVIDEALRQIDEGGPTAVNWRGLARVAGVVPSTLYTYFDSLDALYTVLIVEIYGDMAARVADAVDPAASPPDRVRAAAAGYRRFALEKPARFNLVFTDALPGYAAPEAGPTVTAQIAVMTPFIDAMRELASLDDPDVGTWPDPLRHAALAMWTQLHGAVSLEANHHLDWVPDVDVIFGRVVDGAIAAAERAVADLDPVAASRA